MSFYDDAVALLGRRERFARAAADLDGPKQGEEAIALVLKQQEPIELAPQNAYIRRLQHQRAERANVVSRSRGREPYRRVRLYPDEARAWR